jgi:hypothetical protein
MKTLMKKLRILITFVLSFTGIWVLFRKILCDGILSLRKFVISFSNQEMSFLEWLLWLYLIAIIGFIIVKLWEDKS